MRKKEKLEIREIPFEDGNLLGIKDENGQVWLAVKKACLEIGLSEGQGDRQIKNIKKEEVFNTCPSNLTGSPSETKAYKTFKVNMDSQKRDVFFIHEEYVSMWLAKISLTPKIKKENPEAVKKLVAYQLRAARVLYEEFYATEKQKAELHESLDMDSEIADIKTQVVSMSNKLDSVMENMTISTRQQQKLLFLAKDRVGYLLGGAHSKQYKKSSRLYFSHIWMDLKNRFECSSYKDLNPVYFEEACKFVGAWQYN